MHDLSKFRAPPRVVLLTLLLVFIYLFARSRFLAPISWDEEQFLWQGWLVKSGSVPYRDFFEQKPPLIFFANALGIGVFGLEPFLFRIVPTVIAVVSIVVFYTAMIRRQVVHWLAALLTAQVALWLLGPDFHDTGLNDSETYGFAFTLLGFSIGLLTASVRGDRSRVLLQILSGICFGLAICSKELFLFSAIPAWFLAARRPKAARWDRKQLLFSAVGVILVGLAVLGYLATNSALVPYLEVLRFSRDIGDNLCVDIGEFPRVSGFAVITESWTRLHNRLYNFSHLAFVMGLWAALPLLTRQNKKGRADAIDIGIAMAAIVLGMIAVSVGHCFFLHYFLMGTMGLVLLSVIGAEVVTGFLSETRAHISKAAFAGSSVLFLLVAAVPTKATLAQKQTRYHFPWYSTVRETIDRHSKPGDYILASDSPLIYAVMNRKNPLPFGAFTDQILPYIVNSPTLRMDSLRERLEKHPPKVCYFAGVMRHRQEKFHQLLIDPFLSEHHYVKINDQLWYLPDSPIMSEQ